MSSTPVEIGRGVGLGAAGQARPDAAGRERLRDAQVEAIEQRLRELEAVPRGDAVPWVADDGPQLVVQRAERRGQRGAVPALAHERLLGLRGADGQPGDPAERQPRGPHDAVAVERHPQARVDERVRVLLAPRHAIGLDVLGLVAHRDAHRRDDRVVWPVRRRGQLERAERLAPAVVGGRGERHRGVESGEHRVEVRREGPGRLGVLPDEADGAADRRLVAHLRARDLLEHAEQRSLAGALRGIARDEVLDQARVRDGAADLERGPVVARGEALQLGDGRDVDQHPGVVDVGLVDADRGVAGDELRVVRRDVVARLQPLCLLERRRAVPRLAAALQA